MKFLSGLLLAALIMAAASVRAEDGYDLWLRYRPMSGEWLKAGRDAVRELVPGTPSATLNIAQAELVRGLGGLLGTELPISTQPTGDGSIIFGTPRSSVLIARLKLDGGASAGGASAGGASAGGASARGASARGASAGAGGLPGAGNEGYIIRTLAYQGHRVIVIAGNTEIGVLYGTFHFLRVLQTHQSLEHLDIASAPHIHHRILDHWDNLDRTVERGYAGESIWDWHKLPDYLDPRYTDYARACASLGINGTVLTNVNASPVGLTRLYLQKYAALADLFRPYGLRVYVTARFSAPIESGHLKTADPLDPAVRAWWRAKADEIYTLIPDFGGFLVKANSEGQPGPQDYSRTHADGANMLAEAVAPHDGIIMWRAFVYSQHQPDDRAKQAYSEFTPLDGKFRDNVMLQVKNGPIDFQPREPFHPLFGAMPRTPMMLEFQITKEYLGFATHLVYLAPLFEETLLSDTYTNGKDSTVAKVIDGSLFHHDPHTTGMAGVANIGSDRNWTGSHFDQANWYAFGRLAWDPALSSADIAAEWVKMTFSSDPAFVSPVVGMMMGSREAAVEYMTPLGLHHQMARHTHYGPGPWVGDGARADWTSVYFNRADSQGIGFDRTATGSNAISQYAPQVAGQFADLKRIPEKYLLWFHHVPWDYHLTSGRTLWDELVIDYTQGVQRVSRMRKTWAGLAAFVDPERYVQVSAFLAIQEKEAKWWRDASIAYFQTFAHRPLPAGYEPPQHDLQYYESLCFPYVPGAEPKLSCN